MDGHEQKWVPELWVISTLTAVIILCSVTVTVTQVHYHPLPTDCKSSFAPMSLPNNIIQPAEEAELRTYQVFWIRLFIEQKARLQHSDVCVSARRPRRQPSGGTVRQQLRGKTAPPQAAAPEIEKGIANYELGSRITRRDRSSPCCCSVNSDTSDREARSSLSSTTRSVESE